MANRESAFIEITPEVLLKATPAAIFPMAAKARRSGPVLDRARKARDHPHRSLSWRRGSPHRALRPLHRHVTAISTRDRGLRRIAARSSRTLINDRIRTLYRKPLRAPSLSQHRGLRWERWSAGSTGSRSGRAYSARACPRARDASKVAPVHLVRGSRPQLSAARHPVRTDHLRSFGAVEMPGAVSQALEAALIARAISLRAADAALARSPNKTAPAAARRRRNATGGAAARLTGARRVRSGRRAAVLRASAAPCRRSGSGLGNRSRRSGPPPGAL